MQYLETQGVKLPALGLGTWRLRGGECRRVVEQALNLGYRHIDTAQAYDNEDEIGLALSSAAVDRSELFVTTKIGDRNHAADAVARSIEQSLADLRTDYLDLLLIHWPVDYDILSETLDAMLRLRDAGKVRHLGVSNFSPQQFEEAATQAPIFTNQVEYHPFLDQSAVLAAARGRDALLTAYSPVARGRVMRDRTLQEIARAHDKTPAQVSLRWLLDQDGVIAIPKAASPDHLKSNLEIFDFQLSDEERARIDQLKGHGQRLVPVD